MLSSSSKEQTEKRFMQSVQAGHYIDVQTAQEEWKLAKVIDKDKRNVYVTLDGEGNRQQQPYFINSHRVAPLRSFTEGYTGPSVAKGIYRYGLPKLLEMSNLLEKGTAKFFHESTADPYEITQILRGKLFVFVHEIIVNRDFSFFSSAELKEVQTFLLDFVKILLRVIENSKQSSDAYFSGGWSSSQGSAHQHSVGTKGAYKVSHSQDLGYLVDWKTALICSLQQLLYLWALITTRTDDITSQKQSTSSVSDLLKMGYGKSKALKNECFDELSAYFQQRKGLDMLYQIFCLNDSGKWYPASVRKLIFLILKKCASNPTLKFVLPPLPQYDVRDFQQFYSIYPLMIRSEAARGKTNPQHQKLVSNYIEFSIGILLKANSPFDAKLKSIYELKQTLQDKHIDPFYARFDKSEILKRLARSEVMESLLNESNFNPEIFKRFVPIVHTLTKTKSLTLHHIKSLFRVIETRHQSETELVFEILTRISEFAPLSLLDQIYEQTCKLPLDNEHTIDFVRLFTVKAIENLSKNLSTTSYMASFFTKKKMPCSSKYGFYGLSLLFEESLDGGRIRGLELTLYTLKQVEQILSHNLFQAQREDYLFKAIRCLQVKDSPTSWNIGHGIKLITSIVNMFEDNSGILGIGEDRKKIIEKVLNQSVAESVSTKSKSSKANGGDALIPDIIEGLRKMIDTFESQRFNQEKTAKLESSPNEEPSKQCEDPFKIPLKKCIEYFFELVEQFEPYSKLALLTTRQIEFLWLRSPYPKFLLDFLSRSKQKLPDPKNPPLPNVLPPHLVEEICKNIFVKESFYKNRFLSLFEFESVYEMLTRYHLVKGNIEVNNLKNGLPRYYKSENVIWMGFDYFFKFLLKVEDELWFEKATRRTVELLLRPKDPKVTAEERVSVWMNLFSKLLCILENHPHKILGVINIFMVEVQGRMFKEITSNDSPNVSIRVLCEDVEKTIVLERHSTIFRLRQLIKEKFPKSLAGRDFKMYNVKLKKNISFEEEEDFSVNAMPLNSEPSPLGSSASIVVELLEKKRHHQQECIRLFKEKIENDRSVYDIVFHQIKSRPISKNDSQKSSLNAAVKDQEQLFWKTVSLLPINRNMLEEVKNCSHFTLENWQNYLNDTEFEGFSDQKSEGVISKKSDTGNGGLLEYKLSIIKDLAIKNEEWGATMVETQGLKHLLDLLQQRIKLYQRKDRGQNAEKMIQKLVSVVLVLHCNSSSKGYVNEDSLLSINSAIAQLIIKGFSQKKGEESEEIKVSLGLTNKLLELFLSNVKTYNRNKKSSQDPPKDSLSFEIPLCNFLSILKEALFLVKSQDSNKFADQIAISMTFTIFDDIQKRLQILDFLMNLLNLEFLTDKNKCEHYFKYLTTILYSLTEDLSQIKKDKCQTLGTESAENKIKNDENQGSGIKSTPLGPLQSYLSQIELFVGEVVKAPSVCDSSPSQSNQLLNGALNLLKYVLAHKSAPQTESQKAEEDEMFQLLISELLLPPKAVDFSEQTANKKPRLKTEKNKKVLFELLKRYSFDMVGVEKQTNNAEAICSYPRPIIEAVEQFLQSNNSWRKNGSLDWALEPASAGFSQVSPGAGLRPFVGLANLGATCYMNCLFQQMFMIRAFRDNFMAIDSREYRPKQNQPGSESVALDQNQFFQLQKIFYELKYSNKKSTSASSFCKSFITYEGTCIDPMIQSDADEFLNILMEKMEKFLNASKKHDVLGSTFEGKLSDQLNGTALETQTEFDKQAASSSTEKQESECPHRRQKIQNFMSIGVNVKNKKTLQDALKGYVEGEILDGDNSFYCEQCDKKVKTVKRLCIKELPNILIIVLKRFEFNYDELRKIKINSFLEFPEALDMTEYTSDFLAENCKPELGRDANKYSLRGCVIHSGTSEAGHYYSFIKDEGRWFEFNDEHICEATYSRVKEEGFGCASDKSGNSFTQTGVSKEEEEFIKMSKSMFKNAYMLFYEKNSPRENQAVETESQSTIENAQNALEDKLTQEQGKEQQILLKGPQGAQFTKFIKGQVYESNYVSEMLRILLDANFIRFCENLSIIEHPKVKKFVLQYFHCALLRFKGRFEFSNNFFRICMKILENPLSLCGQSSIKTTEPKTKKCQNEKLGQELDLATWFLQQITLSYIKEFLIEAPKPVRYVCVSLVVKAVSQCNDLAVIRRLMHSCVKSLRKTGMMPFAKIFVALLQKPQAELSQQIRQELIKLKFPQTICALLESGELPQSSQENPAEDAQEVSSLHNQKPTSFFGEQCGSSKNQCIEKEKCSSALLESLLLLSRTSKEEEAVGHFMKFQTLLRLNQSFSFLSSNQLIAERLSERFIDSLWTHQDYEPTVEQVEFSLSEFQQNLKKVEDRVISSHFGKEFLDKYFFLIRAIWNKCYEKRQKLQNNRGSQHLQIFINSTFDSVARFLLNCLTTLDPMLYGLRTLNQFAYRDASFREQWKKYLKTDCAESYPSLKNSLIRYLSNELEKPQFLLSNEEWKQKTSGMNSLNHKLDWTAAMRDKMERESLWMFGQQHSPKMPPFKGLESFRDLNVNCRQQQLVCIRNRRVFVNQLLSCPEPESASRLLRDGSDYNEKDKESSGTEYVLHGEQQLIYLVTPQEEKNQRWAFVEKSEIQFFNSL